jgi:hypothetical protein
VCHNSAFNRVLKVGVAMQLCIQDEGFDRTFSLHEALLTAACLAEYGAGAYAFVTAGGLDLVFQDSVFEEMVKKGSYDLVVGIDNITNLKALGKLEALVNEFSGKLSASVYFAQGSPGIFHPKFSWFKNKEGGSLVLGSGNLTESGLRINTEAFVIEEVDEDKINEIIRVWDEWIAQCGCHLKLISDDVVIQQAKLNASKRVYLPRRKAAAPPETQDGAVVTEDTETQYPEIILEEDLAWTYSLNAEALIVEVPKAGDRWKQVNFDKETFSDYFGATPGVNGQYRILLRCVNDDGHLEETETRLSISVASQNYRFELNAASGLSYPVNGEKPICIFIRIARRMFLYSLFMPGSSQYSVINTYITEERLKSRMRNDRMFRKRLSVSELIDLFPEIALVDYCTEVYLDEYNAD